MAETLTALSGEAQDAAAAALARQYAEALDDATGVLALIRRELDEIRSEAGREETIRQRLVRCERAVDAGALLAELGPRLLAVLDALGATPKARGTAKGVPDVARRLEALRARRIG